LNLIRAVLALVAILLCVPLFANDTPPASSPRYTFSWPLDGSGLMPRGGTTKGPAVTLDKSESPAWQRLQEKGLTDLERDRRAILAMAGTYRVTFDFLEVTPFGGDDKPKAPYQSWGTEKVYVDSDQGESISLVHILEMRIVQPDGKISEPMVTKHWRQDWTYQPTHIVRYQGKERWERRMLALSQTSQRWVQTVYQVDESPRYASIGKWAHTGSFSSWLSEETWRPLPRREWSVRDDYQVLAGTNRHTILANGWVQEENNLKAVLTSARELDPARPYVGREYGVARYERIRDADFAAADQYYERTKDFWDQVRDRWSKLFADRGFVTLTGPVDKLGLFQPLFQHADAIAEQGKAASKKNQAVIESALKGMDAL
jgi:uncharacterized protein DUF6607